MSPLPHASKTKWFRWALFLLVVVLIAQPELAHLGLFIDSAGLDLLLLLCEAQVLLLVGLALRQAVAWTAWAAPWSRLLDGYMLRNTGPFGQWLYVHCAAAAQRGCRRAWVLSRT